MIQIKYSLPASYIFRLVGIGIVACWLLASCTTTRHYSYLKTIQKDTTISNFITNDFESKIIPGDKLDIKVTSLSASEDVLFNNAAAPAVAEGVGGFEVAPDGTVLLHRLGRVPVAGLTRRELQAKLEKDLLGFMKEPIVNVQYVNHKVTVLGAVSKPGIVVMPEEQMNIFEVLVKSGDVKTDGMKNRVMIVREEGKDKKVKLVDLEDQQIFTSPWYYIKPNDIVLVNEDTKSKDKQEKRQELRMNMALVASAASLILIIADRVFR